MHSHGHATTTLPQPLQTSFSHSLERSECHRNRWFYKARLKIFLRWCARYPIESTRQIAARGSFHAGYHQRIAGLGLWIYTYTLPKYGNIVHWGIPKIMGFNNMDDLGGILGNLQIETQYGRAICSKPQSIQQTQLMEITPTNTIPGTYVLGNIKKR
jgi:hypothetical protein